ncbi:unnamed protein product, partial [Meganyctiphanes norvegica]
MILNIGVNNSNINRIPGRGSVPFRWFYKNLYAELVSFAQSRHSGRIQRGGGREVVSASALDSMVANCMRDDDEDVDVDEDDSDLLAELSACMEEDAPIAPSRPAPSAPYQPAPVAPRQTSPSKSVPNATYANNTPAPILVRPAPMAAGQSLVQLLTERIANYETSEAHAKATGNSSRARRLNRGLKTLNQMLRYAKSGKPVNEEDIPPEVVVKLSDGGSGGSTPSSAASAAASPAATSPAATSPTDEALPAMPPQKRPSPTPSPEKSRPPSSIIQNVAFGDSKPLQPIAISSLEPHEQNQRAGVHTHDQGAQMVIEQLHSKYKYNLYAKKNLPTEITP